MKVAVIGAGAIGLAVAASMVDAGIEPVIVARGAAVEALRKQGIKVTGVLGEHSITPEKFSVVETTALLPVCDGILITTKTNEVTAALKPFVASFSGNKQPFVLLLQNGWGSAEEVRKMLPPGALVYSGSSQTGIERKSPCEVRINGHGRPILAGTLFKDNVEPISQFTAKLNNAFLPFSYDEKIEQVLLRKLLFSLCLNPLSAILKCTYGELRDNEHAIDIMKHLADEAMKSIAKVRGITLFKDGADYVLNDLIPNHITSNSKHRSSMLQDIESGRKTEINHMSGAISAMGREGGIPTPYNDMMSSLILGLEKTRSTGLI